MNKCGWCALAVVCLLAVPARAQDGRVQTEPSVASACAGQKLTDFKIKSARVDDPFWILRWRKLDQATLDAVKALESKPYNFNIVNAVSKMIRLRRGFRTLRT